MNRVEKMIMKEVAWILYKETSDPRISTITITRVEMTRDLKMAKVFCSFLEEEEQKRELLKGLKNASSFIRTQLARRVSIKFVPRISFREDVLDKKTRDIDNIFDKINKEKNT